MELVLEIIVEYLRENRRLVVPNFGTFMVKESGEKVFSDLLRTDDGVLGSLLRERGLTELESAVTIDRFVFHVRREIEQNGYCRLDNLGTLRIEPDKRVIRLYEPVRSEVNVEIPSTPYIPEPVSVAEAASIEAEANEAERVAKQSGAVDGTGQGLLSLYNEPQGQKHDVEVVVAEPKVEEHPATKPTTPKPTTPKPAMPKPSTTKPSSEQAQPKPRKKFDVVMLLAIIIVVMALAAIAYGWYVGSLADYSGAAADDAQMNSLRRGE